MYTTLLSTVISSCSLNHHLYTDDSAVFSLPSHSLRLQHRSLSQRSRSNFVLGDCKSYTELLQDCSLVSVNNLPKSTPHSPPLTLLETPASYLTNTPLFLTRSHMSPNLANLQSYHIRQLRCIRPYLDTKTPSTIATSIVQSKLDYCNSPSQPAHLRPPGSNRSRTLLHMMLSKLPNPVTSPPSFGLCTH